VKEHLQRNDRARRRLGRKRPSVLSLQVALAHSRRPLAAGQRCGGPAMKRQRRTQEPVLTSGRRSGDLFLPGPISKLIQALGITRPKRRVLAA